MIHKIIHRTNEFSLNLQINKTISLKGDMDTCLTWAKEKMASDFGYESWDEFVRDNEPRISKGSNGDLTVRYGSDIKQEIYKIKN